MYNIWLLTIKYWSITWKWWNNRPSVVQLCAEWRNKPTELGISSRKGYGKILCLYLVMHLSLENVSGEMCLGRLCIVWRKHLMVLSTPLTGQSNWPTIKNISLLADQEVEWQGPTCMHSLVIPPAGTSRDHWDFKRTPGRQ